jgi:hypothetical protein
MNPFDLRAHTVMVTLGASLGAALHWSRGPEEAPEVQRSALEAVPAGECETDRARLEVAAGRLADQVAELEALRAGLKYENDLKEGALVPWPAELEAKAGALEAEVAGLARGEGGELVEADCGEYPCVFHLRFGRDPSGEGYREVREQLEGLGWSVQGEVALSGGEGRALVGAGELDHNAVFALWPPRGPQIAEADRRRAGRRVAELLGQL